MFHGGRSLSLDLPTPTRLHNSLQSTSDRTDLAYPCDLSATPTLTGNNTPDALVQRHLCPHKTSPGIRHYSTDCEATIDRRIIGATDHRIVRYCSYLDVDPPCVTYCSIDSLNRPANETFLGRTRRSWDAHALSYVTDGHAISSKDCYATYYACLPL